MCHSSCSYQFLKLLAVWNPSSWEKSLSFFCDLRLLLESLYSTWSFRSDPIHSQLISVNSMCHLESVKVSVRKPSAACKGLCGKVHKLKAHYSVAVVCLVLGENMPFSPAVCCHFFSEFPQCFQAFYVPNSIVLSVHYYSHFMTAIFLVALLTFYNL